MKSLRKFWNKRKEARRQKAAADKASPNGNIKSAPAGTNDQMANGIAKQEVLADATSDTLAIALQNKSSSSNVYAYITGLAIKNNNTPVFIQSDGHTVYYPQSPSKTLSPLGADCAIRLGAPGSTTNVTIPKLAGGRIWFSIDQPLAFYLNPGPAIVEPSVSNSSDSNINIRWSFAEFTFNDAQLFANISYVDFVSVPIGISLTNTSGATQTVSGMASNGFDTVVSKLRSQASADKQPWDQLIYSANGSAIRALSPNNLRVGNSSAFSDYWNPYIQQVWSKFASQDMTINTQASAGNLTGRITNGTLNLGAAGSFNAPSASDIFSCSTGPFATGDNQARNAVIPRLAAAFNRSTLLDTNQFPNGSTPANYYKNSVTNHYARIIHEVNRDGRGYAFPYDDVVPDGGSDVAGTIFDGSPKLFTLSVGGG